MRRYARAAVVLIGMAAGAVAADATAAGAPSEADALGRLLEADLPGARLVAFRGDFRTVVFLDLAGICVTSVARIPAGPHGEEPSRPWWSRDGREAIVARGGRAFVLRADGAAARRVLPNETVHEPMFWTDPATGERCILYKTREGGFRYGSSVPGGATYLFRTESGTKTRLADFPFDAGLSLDGTHLGEAFSSLVIKELPVNRVYVLNRGGQACHGSMSPDNTYRMMHLSQHHAYIRVRDKFDRVHWRLRIPDGARSWQAPRWSNHPNFGAAVARYEDGYRLVVFRVHAPEAVVLHSLGTGWSCPHLWIPSGVGAGADRPSPIADLPLERLVAYKDRLARTEDYSPILAELAGCDDPEARAIIDCLETIAREKLAAARAAVDPFEARALYMEVATRFARHPLGDEARERFSNPALLQALEVRPFEEHLDELLGHLSRAPDDELEYAGQGFYEANRPVLLQLARLTREIEGRFRGTDLAGRAQAVRRKYALDKFADEQTPERVEVVATLEAVSPTPTYQQIAPYRDALTFMRYRVDRVLAGRDPEPRIVVVHWGMRSAVPTDAASWRPPRRQRLTLELLAAHPELEGFAAGQEADDPNLVPYFAVHVSGAD